MPKNDYLVAKIGVDTAENEPERVMCRGLLAGDRLLVAASVGGIAALRSVRALRSVEPRRQGPP